MVEALLYYYPVTDVIHWGRMPPGSFSVDRFLHDEPAWRSEARKPEAQKRTLVLCDWAIAGYYEHEFSRCREVFSRLLQEGFTLYAWKKGGPVRVTSDNLVAILRDVKNTVRTPKDQEILIREMAKHNVSKDELGIIDHFACKELCFDEKAPTLESHHVIDNSCELDTLMATVGKRALHDVELVTSGNGHDNNYYFRNVLEAMPHNKRSLTLKKVSILNKQEIGDVKNQNLESVETYAFSYNQELPTQELGEFLLKTSNLKHLDISGCKGISGSFDSHVFDALSLEHLQTLRCSNSTITSALLEQILLKAPNLKTIYIDGCENLAGGFEEKTLEKLDFSQLETFSCRKAVLSGRLFTKILKHPQAIKVLHPIPKALEPALEQQVREDQEQLPALEELDLQWFPVPADGLCEMLKNAPHLKRLNLRGCRFDTPLTDEQFALLDLSHLEELDLWQANIHNHFLWQLLQKAPKLANLVLEKSSRTSSEGEESFANLDLRSLKTLNLSSSLLRTELAKKLIGQAPNLEYLELIKYSDINALFNQLEDVDVSHLRELICSKSDVTDDALIQFLSHTPNIQALDLVFCSNITNKFGKWLLEHAHLVKNLDHVDVSFSAVTQDVQKSLNALWPPRKNKAIKESSKRTGTVSVGVKERDSYFLKTDADTKPQDSTSTVTRTLFGKDGNHPEVTYYRKSIYDSLRVKGELQDKESPFIWYNERTQEYVACAHEIVRTQSVEAFTDVWKNASIRTHTHVQGIIDITEKDEWITLPSVSADEKITHIYGDVDIRYSKRDNLYSVRNRSQGPVKVHYLLEVPKHKEKVYFEPGIESLIKECKNYAEAELEMKSAKPSGQEYLEALINQKKGSCRHRAVTFYTLMKRHFPDTQVRMISNGVHAFIEIFVQGSVQGAVQGRWVQVDLGGYPAGLQVIEPESLPTRVLGYIQGLFSWALECFYRTPVPEKAQEEVLPQHALLESKVIQAIWNGNAQDVQQVSCDFSNARDVKDFVKQNAYKPGKNVHIGVHSQEELDSCSYMLQKEIKHAYYIDRPEDIRCSSRFVDKNGNLQKGPGGPLYDYLKTTKNPVLIINFNTFSPDDIARCNAIIERERREADGAALPENTCVIGLSLSGPNTYSGKDFTSRFFHRVQLAPFAASYPISFETKKKPTAFIDLFGASDWKEKLQGYWNVQGNSFVWKKGFLEKGHKVIEIKNGPWENRDFRLFWQQLALKKKLSIVKTSDVNWEQFKDTVTFVEHVENPIILNQSTLGEMARSYSLNYDGTLSTLPGKVKAAKDGTLSAYMTSNITDSQWYRLLHLCKKYNVKIKLAAPEGVTSPLNIPTIPQKRKSACDIIVTTNVDYTVRRLEDGAKVFDISDCGASLIETVEPTWISDTEFRFKRVYGAIHKALTAGEHVILKGNFSSELQDALMPLLLEKKFPGRLTLVSGTNTAFELFYTKQDVPDPIPALDRVGKLPEILLPADLHPFDRERVEAVLQALNRDHHVCIEGDSGVGKTSCMIEILAKIPGIKLFFSVKDWASYQGPDIPILFNDEVNLQNRQFSLYEGMYHGGIILDGQYYPLTPKHKMVSAQNPLSYGGERKSVEFLERHKNTIQFTPFTSEYLRDKVLGPYKLPEKSLELFLEVYKKGQVLTPRELEMMALVTLARPESDAREIAYRIAYNALEKQKREEFSRWFKERFGMPELLCQDVLLDDYILTSSRKEAYRVFQDLLAVRELKKKKDLPGGLGGLVLEGAPGDGKSHFAVSALIANGFTQLTPHEIGDLSIEKAFCRMPANMPVEEKRACLLAAFNAGHVVIEDEINVSPSLEALHNALLMGRDVEGRAPTKPGFLLIGTQNPIYFAGRRAQSLALQRRVITIEFTSYLQHEIKQIIHARFPELHEKAQELLSQKRVTFRELLSLIEKGLQGEQHVVDPLPEGACLSKLYALSALMDWQYKKSPQNFEVPPDPEKIREYAIRTGYTEDTPTHLVELAKKYGYTSSRIITGTKWNYAAKLKACLDRNQAPIVFQGDKQAIAVGYFHTLEGELTFTLLQDGKSILISAKDLIQSACKTAPKKRAYTKRKLESFHNKLVVVE